MNTGSHLKTGKAPVQKGLWEVLTQALRTRDENGGLLDLRQCLKALRLRRSEPISVEDLERAVECLAQPLERVPKCPKAAVFQLLRRLLGLKTPGFLSFNSLQKQ